MEDLSQLLKKYWGYEEFRPQQQEIISSVIAGHDTLALLPTGGGKSLCYQLPAMALEGLCVVVSPLIALMKDQVQHLTDIGIRSACLISGMNQMEQEIVLNHCLYGNRRIKILYVSPERLKNRLFINHFRQMQVSLIAVDEAHCISHWGYDFRPTYLDIAKIRQYHPQTPVLALTATATPRVVEDIQQKLLFRVPRVFQTSFYRSNLVYSVSCGDDKLERLIRILGKVQGSGIVYVRNRKKTAEIANFLNGKNISATFYHAGLDGKERDVRQNYWMTNQCRVMVATSAFGMGIDKPDVRFVVHLDIPSSPELYFQEAGRAGRDGQKSFAILLYSQQDEDRLKLDYELEYPPMQRILAIYRAMGNYYQIPVGGGYDQTYPLDVQALCQTYAFAPKEFYAAARFLEREGLVMLPEREETESKLMVVASSEEVYRFQVENKRYGNLVQVVLRMYGGLFVDFVTIDEKSIARRCNLTEDQVTKMLLHLEALKIVQYKKKHSGQVIYFPTERVDVSNYQLCNSDYNRLKELAGQRMQAMLEYVHGNQCRNRMLLSYFGEEKECDCGTCDNCLRRTKTLPADLQQQVLAVVKEHGPIDIKALLALLPDAEEDAIEKAVRRLLDNRQLGMNADFQIWV